MTCRYWPFRRELAKLNRKHRSATRTVEAKLDEIESAGVPEMAMKYPGLGGRPVFTLRVRIGHQRKRACRLIFHHEAGSGDRRIQIQDVETASRLAQDLQVETM